MQRWILCSAAFEKIDFCQLIPQISQPPVAQRSAHQKGKVGDSSTTVPTQHVEYGYQEWTNKEFGDKAMEELKGVFEVMETEEEEGVGEEGNGDACRFMPLQVK